MSDEMIQQVGRRQFLRGLGGLSLALPLLPSLLPREAQANLSTRPKRFVAMATHHGGIWRRNMFPAAASLTRQQSYAGHTIREGDLSLGPIAGNRVGFSPVLSAPATLLTPERAARVNVLEGIDIPFYIAHHSGGYLGNYARNDGNGGDGMVVQAHPWPTIDQVMAWSSDFYPSLDGVVRRSIVSGANNMSYNYSNPIDPNTPIQPLTPQNSSRALFTELFGTGMNEQNMRTPVADRVLENYQRLRTSNKRLSSEDRRRLDAHIQHIHELQRKLNTQSSCEGLTPPTRDSQSVRHERSFGISPPLMRDFWQLQNEVIATALLCGASRVAVMHCADTFSTFDGDWHQDVAHQAEQTNGTAQTIIADAHQRFFEHVFMDLVQRMDVEDVPGVNLLDSSLIMWVQESGNITHDSYSIPIVTAGSAGGFFRTGRYVDYRDRSKLKRRDANREEDTHPGLIYNQWLANVMQAMGVPASAYERGGQRGYGHFFIGQHGWYQSPEFYPHSVRQVLGERLPFITA